MKLGNKYQYFTRHKTPTVEDYGDNLNIAKILLELYEKVGKWIDISSTEFKLKTWRKRSKNIELRPGNKVNVCRWDWNGIHEVVDVTEIKESEFSIKVICKQGYFVFDGKNEPEFQWNRSKGKWYKEYMTRIDQKQYYYETK